MVSILQGVEHSDVLGSPARIVSVITDAARSMTTDTGLDLPTMIGIIESLRHLPPGSVQFIELPTVPYPPDPNWVSWPASDAGLFSAIARDQEVHPAAKESGRKVAAVQVVADTGDGSPRHATALSAQTPHPGNLARSYGGITGSTNVCRDTSAFAGPRGGA